MCIVFIILFTANPYNTVRKGIVSPNFYSGPVAFPFMSTFRRTPFITHFSDSKSSSNDVNFSVHSQEDVDSGSDDSFKKKSKHRLFSFF